MKADRERHINDKSVRTRGLALGIAVVVVLVAGTCVAMLIRSSFASTTQPSAANTPLAAIAQAENTPVIPGMPPCDPAEAGSTPAGGVTQASTPLPELVATAIATVAPTAVPVTRAGVFGLAWFHKPPEDGTTASEMAKAHSYIHLTGTADIPYRDKLRAAGYKGPIYTYVSAGAVEGPGPYKNSSTACASGYVPHDNNLAWNTDDFCRYIHSHESWFLHNSKGERLVDDYFGSGRWTYLMNPTDPGWQAFAQERLAFAHDNWGYDGAWLDNLDLDLARADHEEKNSDGSVQEFATDAAWREAMSSMLAGLRARLGDWPIWANLISGSLAADSWDAYAPYLNGAMDESFSVSWLDKWRSADEWKGQLERAERWLAGGKGLVMVGQGAKTDLGRMRFTLASYMLVAQGQEAFYRYTRFDSYYNALWQYPEFDTARALGAPTGPRQETQPGVWTRQFANGTVQVDLNAHEGKLTLK